MISTDIADIDTSAREQRGELIGYAKGKPVNLNLDRLIKGRLLVQAMSGAGKSYMLRLLAERFVPKVQTIIFDSESEFFTLHDKLDMVLIGDGGELKPDPEYAGKLAKQLLTMQTSAIVDLSALGQDARRRFMRHFCTAMIDAPKSLWHPVLLLIDEAHSMCPERGMGEAESTQAVIDLAEKGRKRGLAIVLATQRLSKLHKNAAAECTNVLIGRTSPIDLRRAANLLGIPQKDRHALQSLDDGEWFGTGPAFGGFGTIRFQGCVAHTDHIEPGRPPAHKAVDNPRLADATDQLTKFCLSLAVQKYATAVPK